MKGNRGNKNATGKKSVWYACDFETAADKNAVENQHTYVWAWGIMRVGENKTMYHGTDILSFFETCCKLGNGTYWFHNLKFDGTFLLDFLLKSGFNYVSEPDTYKMPECSINTLIDGASGEYYKIIVKITNKVVLKFQNSLRKAPFKISKLAGALKMDVSKGEIDYRQYRPETGYELTEQEYDYLYRDVQILSIALDELFRKQGLNKLTIGADCMADYQKRVPFKTLFPVLESEVDKAIRKAYRGGYCWKKPDREMVYGGCTYDYNSMYPSVMHSKLKYRYPFGEPVYFTGAYETDELYPLYVQRFTATFHLKPDRWPTVSGRNQPGYMVNEYLSDVDEPMELTMTDTDLDWFFKNYDVDDFDVIDGYKFRARIGLFDDYINYWYAVKEQATIDRNAALRQLAKLFLNNLYGKFATNPLGSSKIPYYDGHRIKYQDVTNELSPMYIPVGVFCTAYARNELFKGIEANWPYFVYCDTDSIHCGCGGSDVQGITIDQTALGAWKQESEWDVGKFIRPKTYMEHTREPGTQEYEWVVKCAGMPDNVKQLVTVENFKVGTEYWGKLKPVVVDGGVILVETGYKIRE